MHCRILQLPAVVLVLLTGCAATLKVYPVTDPNVLNGIRVHAAAPYIVTKRIETEKCKPTTQDVIMPLPLGKAYDINFEGGLFAKNEFSVTFNDSGFLKQVTLNSDPQIDETLTAAATLAEKIGGIVALRTTDCGAITRETIIDFRQMQK